MPRNERQGILRVPTDACIRWRKISVQPTVNVTSYVRIFYATM